MPDKILLCQTFSDRPPVPMDDPVPRHPIEVAFPRGPSPGTMTLRVEEVWSRDEMEQHAVFRHQSTTN